MKVLGKWSVAWILKVILSITWYFLILLLVLLLAGFAYVWTQDQYHLDDWPIAIDQDAVCYEITSNNPAISTASVRPVENILKFRIDHNWKTYTIQLCSAIVFIGIILRILYQLRRVLATLIDKNPFDKANVRRLREIALLVLLTPFLGVLRFVIVNLYIRANFDFQVPVNRFLDWDIGLAGDAIDYFGWDWLLFAMAFMVLAEVFRLGAFYKEDSTSIV
jgi:hypothetical protein